MGLGSFGPQYPGSVTIFCVQQKVQGCCARNEDALAIFKMGQWECSDWAALF